MQAVSISKFGEPEVLTLVDSPCPEPAKGEVRVRIRATAINRADILQRRGLYPAPKEVSPDIPGLEFAGEVEAIGANVHEWKPGDRVFGLAAGGTYAEYLVTHARTLARIPDNLTFTEAASIPEAFITAYDAAVVQGKLSAGNILLLTAAGSGVGTAAIQIARAIGATTIGTARKQHKLDEARKIGLTHGILVEDKSFAETVLNITNGHGADVVLELVGGKYLPEDIRCSAPNARILIIGLIGGAQAEVDLKTVLRKRLTMIGSTLRMRPLEEKIAAGQLLQNNLVPLFATGILRPIIDLVLPLAQASQAHRYVENNENFGKVVLEI